MACSLFAIIGFAVVVSYVLNTPNAYDHIDDGPRAFFVRFLIALGVAYAQPIVMIVLVVADAIKELRWQGRSRSLQGRMCGNCLHDLRGLGDAGKCPECGHPFSLDQLRRYWKGIDIPPTE